MSQARSRGSLLLAALVGGALLLWLVRSLERGGRGDSVAVGAVRADQRSEVASDGPARNAVEPVADAQEPGRSSARTAEPGEGELLLHIRVLDGSDWRPLEGAEVEVFDATVSEPALGAATTPLVRRTDAEGRAAVIVRDVRELLRVRVEAPGFLHSDMEWGRGDALEIELTRAASVHGRVLTADTLEPVGGARLVLEHVDCDHCKPDVVVSGADGRYALSSVVRVGDASLTIEAEGFARCERTFSLQSDEATLEQDILLVRGVEVEGRVLDWMSGAGIAGARVSGLETDADGRFQGRVLVWPGTLRTRVFVHAESYADLNVVVDLALTHELEYRLPRLVFLAGTVSDADGEPLPATQVHVDVHGATRTQDGASVERSPLASRPGDWSFGSDADWASADSAGRFRVSVLPWSENVALVAHAAGFQDGVVSIPRVAEPGTEQTFALRLEREHLRDTRVVGEVTLNGSSSEVLRGTVAWRGPSAHGEARFAGMYELVAEPGELTLTFTLDAVPGKLEGAEVHLRARDGECVVRAVELRVESAAISGTVRFGGGTPVARAQLSATCLPTGDHWLYFATETNARGEYVLSVPDIGQQFTVSASEHRESAERRDVVAGTTGLDFVFARRRQLLVRAVDAQTGAPLRLDDQVMLDARAPGAVFETVIADDGTPNLEGWSPFWFASARVDLFVRPLHRDLVGYGSRLVRDIDLTPPDGRVARVEFRLERAAPLVLELDLHGAAWPDEHGLVLLEEELWDGVTSSPDGWQSTIKGLAGQRSVDLDEHGRAELTGFAPGRYRFKVAPDDIVLDPPEVVVERSAGLPVLLRWRPR